MEICISTLKFYIFSIFQLQLSFRSIENHHKITMMRTYVYKKHQVSRNKIEDVYNSHDIIYV